MFVAGNGGNGGNGGFGAPGGNGGNSGLKTRAGNGGNGGFGAPGGNGPADFFNPNGSKGQESYNTSKISSSGMGGAIFVRGGNVTITNASNFTNNSARSVEDGRGLGGAIYVLTQNDIQNQKLINGQGLPDNPPTLTIGQSVTFTGNTASSSNTKNQIFLGTDLNTDAIYGTTSNVFNGKTIDGFIQGGKVFLDANLNGILDQGEITTTTNRNGQFQLSVDEATFTKVDTNQNGIIDLNEGRLAMIGGIDSGSELPFEGILTAPANSDTTIITPFTSLVERIGRQLITDGNINDPATTAKDLILSKWRVPEFGIASAELKAYRTDNYEPLDPAATLITASEDQVVFSKDYGYKSFYEASDFQRFNEASKTYLVGIQVQLISEQLAAFTGKPINQILDVLADYFLNNQDVDLSFVGDQIVAAVAPELDGNLVYVAGLATDAAVAALTTKAVSSSLQSEIGSIYDNIFQVNAESQNVAQGLQYLLEQLRVDGNQITVKDFNDAFSISGLEERFYNDTYTASNIFPPNTADFSVSLVEDGQYIFKVSDFPFLKDDPDPNDTLQSVLIELEDPLLGTLKLGDQEITDDVEITVDKIEAGLLTYTPFANDFGDDYDYFNFRVADGKFFSDESYEVTINVTAVNDAPIAQDDIATTSEDAAVNIDILANDQDIDNDSLNLAIGVAPVHGTVKINDNNTPDNKQDDFITYLPLAGFVGTDTFTYQINDDNGGQATANVNVTVDPKPGLYQTAAQANNNLLQFIGNLNQAKLEFTLANKQLSPFTVHEVGVFAVEDDQGRVNGLLPGDAGYIQAALEYAKVIFSVLPDDFIANPSRILSNEGNYLLGFYLVQNGTTDEVVNNPNAANKVLLGSPVGGQIPSTLGIKATGQLHQFQLDFKTQGNSSPVLSLILNPTDTEQPIGSTLQLQGQQELVDLTAFAGQSIQALFPVVASEAGFNNNVGFYQIEDTQGTVRDPITGALIKPGDAAYTQAALRNSQTHGMVFDRQKAGISGTWEGGHLYAPFIIANSTLDKALAGNSSNVPVYFAYLGANPDKVDHIRSLGNNTWGFEDLSGGGDLDFNDIVIRGQFSLVA